MSEVIDIIQGIQDTVYLDLSVNWPIDARRSLRTNSSWASAKAERARDSFSDSACIASRWKRNSIVRCSTRLETELSFSQTEFAYNTLTGIEGLRLPPNNKPVLPSSGKPPRRSTLSRSRSASRSPASSSEGFPVV